MPNFSSTEQIALRDYKIKDNIWSDRGTVFLSGTQALVRLMRMQRQQDERSGSIRRGSSVGTVVHPWAWWIR